MDDELICLARGCFGFCVIDGEVAACPDCGAKHVKVEGVWRKVKEGKKVKTFVEGEHVKVQNWRGEWDYGNIRHVYDDGMYEVECCGLYAKVKASDLRKVKDE